MNTKQYTMTGLAVGALALQLPFALSVSEAQANEHYGGDRQLEEQHHDWMKSKTTNWKKMREKVVEADNLMSGHVSDRFTQVGNVRDLILSEDGDRVEYILYEVPYLSSLYGGEDGFVRFDNVEMTERWGTALTLTIDDEDDQYSKDQLTLTKDESWRLLSNIIDSPVNFDRDGSVTRDVEDVLINRNSGEVTHLVVQMDEDAWFNEEPRALPIGQVVMEPGGKLVSMVKLDRLDSMQEYAPEFLR